MTDVATRSTGALALADTQDYWTPQQIATLAQLGVDQASEGDLRVFFHQVRATGLDPFAKQIYMIGRWDSRTRGQKYTIQTGIDGYRLIARRAVDRTGETLGYEPNLWCGPDGKWREVWLDSNPPAAAKVTVYRNGQPFPAVALWSEYVQTVKDGSPNSMWSRMGAGQLAKCAEALALRKAFPQDLSGLYTTEEMGQADNAHREPVDVPKPVQAAQQPARNWEDEIDATNDVDTLTRLGREAKQAGVMTDDLVEYFRTRRDILTAPVSAPRVTEDVTDAEVVEEPQLGGDGWPVPARIPS